MMKLSEIKANALVSLYEAKKHIELAIKSMEIESEDTFPGIEDKVVELILRKTLDYYSISLKQLQSKIREQPLPKARQVFCKLCKELLPGTYSLQKIGDFIHKDHATVLHGVKMVNNAQATNDAQWYDFLNIKDQVQSEIDVLLFHNDK